MVNVPSAPGARPRLSDAQRLTAAAIGLAAVFVVARLFVLRHAERAPGGEVVLLPWLPLAVYQDLCFVVALAWPIAALLRRAHRPAWRASVRVAAWAVSIASALVAAVHVQIFEFLSTPLTVRLIAMSDRLRGIRDSIDAAVTKGRLLWVLSAPAALCCVAMVLIHLAPRVVAWVHACAGGWRGRLAFGLYASVAFVTLRASGLDPGVVANPHWALASSLWERDRLSIEGQFARADLEDFQRSSAEQSAAAGEWHAKLANSNVVVVVLESVGSRYLGHYGAPYDNTAELSRLAAGGFTFDRIYSSQPFTSNAMVGIFCSLYPWHGWRSLPNQAPSIRVPGLGNVLERRGYRTALLHTGNMRYDNEHEFLRRHGFAAVHDCCDLRSLVPAGQPVAELEEGWTGQRHLLPDSTLLPAALHWIDRGASQPFFLTLWTIQTHHPYFVAPAQLRDYSRDAELNRYLNAIRSSDELIGELRRGLEARGLADSTLIVVLGDHGEAFRQHGFQGHGQTLYEETVRVPLVIAHAALADGPRRHGVLGQQIDLAPTILDLLGLEPPAGWQGRSLFATERPERVYLFTGFHHYLFGLVERDRKVVVDVTTNRTELYDLNHDPGERTNLLRGVRGRAAVEQSQRRLAGWLHFQNQYLSERIPSRHAPAAE